MNIKEFIIETYWDEDKEVEKYFILIDRDFDTKKDAEDFVKVIKLNMELR